MSPRAFVTALATAFAGFAAAAFTLLAPGAPAHSYSTGAPPGFSGPENYCNACHSSQPDSNLVNSGTGGIFITAPTAFEAGDIVPITVTVRNTTPPVGPEPLQGFQLSARNAADSTHIGTFNVDGTTVQYAGGDPNYVTHTLESNTDSTWTFEWVAPETDAPVAVTFFANGNAADGDGNGFGDNGDKIYSTAHALALVTAGEPPPSPLAFRLGAPYPNPLRATGTAPYTLDRPADVTALLRDGRGRTIRVLERARRGAGAHALRLDARGLAAGTYFVTLSTAEGTAMQRLVVAR